MGDYGVPMMMMLAQGGMQYMQGRQQASRAGDAQKDAQKFYNQTSLPNDAAVNASAVQNRGELGQARLAGQQNLSKNLAARGFGSGSGLGIKGATDIESAYIRGLGESQTELTKFANTRQFAPGQDAYGYSVPSGGEQAAGAGSNMLNTATGMYMANKMLGQGGGAVPATAFSPQGNWLGYGNQSQYNRPGE